MTMGHASYHVPVLVLGVTVATAAMCTRDAEAQCQYEVTVAHGPWCGDIFQYPPTHGKAINEAGDVAGYYTSCDLGPEKAFVWTAEAGLVTLNIPGASRSWAEDIAGQLVVGRFIDPNTEFSIIAFVSDGGSVTPIFPPPGGSLSEAFAVNESGQVVGRCSSGQSFLWQDGDLTLFGPFPLGWTDARDVNNLGQVVGWTGDTAPVNPTARAFIWDDGEAVFLPAIPGGVTSVGQAMNDDGQVVGYGLVQKPEELASHGFIWRDGQMTDLGTLPGYSRSFALDINDRGTVVGWCRDFEGDINNQRAFIWQNGQMTDLNDLFSWKFGMARAFAINNNGQITGDAAGGIAMLLTPVDSPVGDIDGDCQVGIVDFLLLLSNWGLCPPQGACVEDLDGDGVVGIIDFLLLLTNWTA